MLENASLRDSTLDLPTLLLLDVGEQGSTPSPPRPEISVTPIAYLLGNCRHPPASPFQFALPQSRRRCTHPFRHCAIGTIEVAQLSYHATRSRRRMLASSTSLDSRAVPLTVAATPHSRWNDAQRQTEPFLSVAPSTYLAEIGHLTHASSNWVFHTVIFKSLAGSGCDIPVRRSAAGSDRT